MSIMQILNSANAEQIRLSREDRLSISQDIEVFVFDGVESLASVVRLDSKDFLVLLKPEVLDLCTIEELKFVIGHEVGHGAIRCPPSVVLLFCLLTGKLNNTLSVLSKRVLSFLVKAPPPNYNSKNCRRPRTQSFNS